MKYFVVAVCTKILVAISGNEGLKIEKKAGRRTRKKYLT